MNREQERNALLARRASDGTAAQPGETWRDLCSGMWCSVCCNVCCSVLQRVADPLLTAPPHDLVRHGGVGGVWSGYPGSQFLFFTF